MIKIKICGLSRKVDIDMVNTVLPDYIGFVFANSKRQVNDSIAEELKALLNPDIKAVGVFVNDDIDHIIRLCTSGIIDIVQLHGEEDMNYILKLKTLISNPIIKAVRVRNLEDITIASKLPCDYLLLDAYKQDQYGGIGEAFDWTMITKINKPFFLAGGIRTDNVKKAILIAHPYCIDVSSGVETEGWKDQDKVLDIVTKVRSM
ncbi:MAG: N-(5-phosphoribosyl)anthranilate isomerase [Herbinix sp.]|jgi:phosphoribosylanthranilate isomerase|nr:N-(5-phosphoribosyl)anthranilate isomerase [Herbinix sp.]